MLFSVRVEEEESDVLFDGGSTVVSSGGKNWEPEAASLLVKNLAKASVVRGVHGGGGVI